MTGNSEVILGDLTAQLLALFAGREPPIEPGVGGRTHRRRERVRSRLEERAQPVWSTNVHIGTTRRRHCLLDSVLGEYGILSACGDEKRARCNQSEHGAVIALVSESGHE